MNHFPAGFRDADKPVISMKLALTLRRKMKNPIAWVLGHTSNMLITGLSVTMPKLFGIATVLTWDNGVCDHSMTQGLTCKTCFSEEVGLGQGG